MTLADRVKLIRTTSAAGAAAILIAAPVVAGLEGKRNVAYPDLGGVPTACYGHTGPEVVVGKTYTDEQCSRLFSADLERHWSLIAGCVPAVTPADTKAAFLSFAYNVGAPAFCHSSIARKANAGDLRGACAGLDAWVFVKGRKLPGLVNRRRVERALCERGLQPLNRT